MRSRECFRVRAGVMKKPFWCPRAREAYAEPESHDLQPRSGGRQSSSMRLRERGAEARLVNVAAIIVDNEPVAFGIRLDRRPTSSTAPTG